MTWPDPPPQMLARLALGLRRWIKRFLDNLIPEVTLFEDSVGAATTQLLAAAARYRIADLLEEGPRTAAELAQLSGLQTEPLHRSLRALAYRGYFSLDKRGRFANNRLSRTLLTQQEAGGGDFAQYFASSSNLAAWGALDHVLQTGDNSFQAVHRCSVWQWFAEHPEEESRFARAMQGRTYADAPLVAVTYPFAEVGSVCDVGGGQGGLLSEIVLRHPHLEATLLDSPGVLQQARANIERRRVTQIELMSGDFFQQVPSGYQLYILKNILHDWPDERCVEILSNCASAMGPTSRLLIVELTPHTNQAAHFGVVSDVQMMVVTDNGRERSLSELRRLVRRAGLRTEKVFPTATVTLLEARLA